MTCLPNKHEMPAQVVSLALSVLASAGPAPAMTEPAKLTTETILFVRHGEKGPDGLGQLSCRGLNRALALPAVLKARYGHIDAVFAPDPSHKKQDGPQSYDYVRPLATVEPTAIRFGLPVDASFGYEEGSKLRAALLAPEFHDKIVLVGWEHHALNDLVPSLVASLGGKGAAVPKWEKTDFDSIWQVTIGWSGEHASAAFVTAREGLDGQSDFCPNIAAPPIAPVSPLMVEHK